MKHQLLIQNRESGFKIVIKRSCLLKNSAIFKRNNESESLSQMFELHKSRDPFFFNLIFFYFVSGILIIL